MARLSRSKSPSLSKVLSPLRLPLVPYFARTLSPPPQSPLHVPLLLYTPLPSFPSSSPFPLGIFFDSLPTFPIFSNPRPYSLPLSLNSLLLFLTRFPISLNSYPLLHYPLPYSFPLPLNPSLHLLPFLTSPSATNPTILPPPLPDLHICLFPALPPLAPSFPFSSPCSPPRCLKQWSNTTPFSKLYSCKTPGLTGFPAVESSAISVGLESGGEC